MAAALKIFENLQMRFRMNAWTGIGNGHTNAVRGGRTSLASVLISNRLADNTPLPIIGFGRQPNRAFGGGELQGVVQQIGNDMLHFVEVKRKAFNRLSFKVIKDDQLL